jgi:hypothetical protein
MISTVPHEPHPAEANSSHDEWAGLLLLFGTVGILSAGCAVLAWLTVLAR